MHTLLGWEVNSVRMRSSALARSLVLNPKIARPKKYQIDLGTYMHKITLICSAHRENGLCNAGELLKILRKIKPEIVFEEISPSDFDSYYKYGSTRTLETLAISKYAELKLFKQVPVDRYALPANLIAEFKIEMDRIFAYVRQTNQEYLELLGEEDIGVYQFGFRYLNSNACEAMTTRISEMENKTIIETGDQELIHGLERWRRFMERREMEMVGNIYKYCSENAFDTGVFLIGAAHKAGIVKEIEKYANTKADMIEWSLSYDGQID